MECFSVWTELTNLSVSRLSLSRAHLHCGRETCEGVRETLRVKSAVLLTSRLKCRRNCPNSCVFCMVFFEDTENLEAMRQIF